MTASLKILSNLPFTNVMCLNHFLQCKIKQKLIWNSRGIFDVVHYIVAVILCWCRDMFHINDCGEMNLSPLLLWPQMEI